MPERPPSPNRQESRTRTRLSTFFSPDFGEEPRALRSHFQDTVKRQGLISEETGTIRNGMGAFRTQIRAFLTGMGEGPIGMPGSPIWIGAFPIWTRGFPVKTGTVSSGWE
jgi:hypothetical protein